MTIFQSTKILQPTLNLRFIMRDGMRILQQYWTDTYGGGEWVDVRLELDQKNVRG